MLTPHLLLGRIAILVLIFLFSANATHAELVTVWNELTLRAIRYANIPPPVAVRQIAVVHLAMYDAANGVDRRYKPYLVEASAPKERSLAQKKSYGVLESARLFAALNVALADASIVCWDAKYTYKWWRPITAIRAGAADGNPATEPNPKWSPLLNTPPFPEHTSGHSTFSGAAAEVLAGLTDSDEFAFVTTSDGLPGVVRRFRHFSDAAREAGISRIYGGIHFSAANEQGLECGKRVGHYVVQNFFGAQAQ